MSENSLLEFAKQQQSGGLEKESSLLDFAADPTTTTAFSSQNNIFTNRLKSSDDFLGRMGISFDESQKSFFEGLDVFSDMTGFDWLGDVAEAGIERQEKDISRYAPQERSASLTKGVTDISDTYQNEGFLAAFDKAGTLFKDMLATGLGSFGISGASAVGGVAAAPFTGGVSLALPFLVEGTMGAGAIKQTAMDLGASEEDANLYATAGAGPMAVVGRFGAAKVVNGLVKSAGLTKAKQELTEKYGQEVADTIIQKTYRTLAEGVKGGAAEAGTEGIQKAMELGFAGTAADKGIIPMEGGEYASAIIDDAALGFMAGQPIATAGNVLSDARRKAALKVAERQEEILQRQHAMHKNHEGHLIDKGLNAPDKLPDNRFLGFLRKGFEQSVTGLVPLANRVLNGRSVYNSFNTFYDLKSILSAEGFKKIDKIEDKYNLRRNVKVPFMRSISPEVNKQLTKALNGEFDGVPQNVIDAAVEIRSEVFGNKLEDDIKLTEEAIDEAITSNNATKLDQLIKMARDRGTRSHDTARDFATRLRTIQGQINGLKAKMDEAIKANPDPKNVKKALTDIKKNAEYKGLKNATIRQGLYTGRLGEMRQAGIEVDFIENYLPVKYLLDSKSKREAARKVLEQNGVKSSTVTSVFEALADQEYKDTPITDWDYEFDKGKIIRKSAEKATPGSFEYGRTVPENIRKILRDNGFVEDNAMGLISEYIMDSSNRIAVQNVKNDIDKLLSENKDDVEAGDYNRIKDLYNLINHRHKAPTTQAWKTWRDISNWGQFAGFLLTMPLSAFTALSEPFVVMTMLGPKYGLYGAVKALEVGFRKTARTMFPNIKPSNAEAMFNNILQSRDGILTERFADLQETSGPRKWTNRFFRTNLMMQVTQLSRYMVMAGAQKAMLQDGKLLMEDVDAQGKPQTVEGVNARGRLMKLYGIIDPVNNQSLKAFIDSNGTQMDRTINMAMSNIVDQNIMAPNAINRPILMNDPRLALLFQLKSFVTVFGNTVGYRIWKDLTNPMYGNAPENAARAAIGIGMIMAVATASQAMKDALRYGEDESPYDDLEGKEKFFHALFNTGIFGGASFLRDMMTAQQYGSSPLHVLAGPIPGKTADMISALSSGNPRSIARFTTGNIPFLSGLPVVNEIRGDMTDAIEESLIDMGLESSSRKHGGKVVNRAGGGKVVQRDEGGKVQEESYADQVEAAEVKRDDYIQGAIDWVNENFMDKTYEERRAILGNVLKESANFLAPIGHIEENPETGKDEYVLPSVGEAGVMTVLGASLSGKGKKLKSLFSKEDTPLFHVTDVNSLRKILKEDNIKSSRGKGVSLSRNSNFKGWDRNKHEIQLVLSKDSIKNNNKVTPVEEPRSPRLSEEREELVSGDIKSVNNKLKAINILPNRGPSRFEEGVFIDDPDMYRDKVIEEVKSLNPNVPIMYDGTPIDEIEGVGKALDTSRAFNKLSKNEKAFYAGEDGLLKTPKGEDVIVYHSPNSPETFTEFDATKSKMDLDSVPFISFATNPKTIQSYGLQVKDFKTKQMPEGARTIMGKVKSDKIFDHNNPEDIDKVINYKLNTSDDATGKLIKEYEEKTTRKYWEPEYAHIEDKKVREEMIGKAIENSKETLDVFKQINKGKSDELEFLKKNLEEGNFWEIEKNLSVLKKLGYEGFTTYEGGKNVMLFNPEKSFVPLFDPERKSNIGFKEGGAIANLRKRMAKKADGGKIAEATNEPNIDMDLTSVENHFRDMKGVEPRPETMVMPSADINTIAYLESRGDPNAINKGSGATGLFQVTPGTAGWMGHDPEKLLDPEYNKQVFLDYASKNAESLGKYLDRPVEPFDIYMTHQQGIRGYLQLNQFKNRKINKIKNKDIKRNVLNNMLPKTKKRKNPSIEDWINDWKDHYESVKNDIILKDQ